MTREEEAIKVLTTYDVNFIEALSQPIVAKHFDIQGGYIYCSPQIAENVKVVVRCKDCRYRGKEEYPVCCETADDWYCASGERRKE